ncbi:MAG: histidine phosphatase family protein [Gammaproteobacteria bacterium]
MKLLLMRHADAGSVDPIHYPNDDLRPLSEVGNRVQEDLARIFKRMDIQPDHILTSPRLRTLQTATVTAKGLGLEERLMQTDALGKDYSVTAVVTLLATFNEAETMLCVGHEPDLRELSSALLGLKSGMGIKFPKSGLMRIDFRAFAKVGAGHLHFFYRPHDLLALA